MVSWTPEQLAEYPCPLGFLKTLVNKLGWDWKNEEGKKEASLEGEEPCPCRDVYFVYRHTECEGLLRIKVVGLTSGGNPTIQLSQSYLF
eukprot:8256503-Pyramimonas_sp.AAC.3